MEDIFDLTRFVDSQARVYGEVLNELRSGQKRTHWMWFVFPQVRGLGSSPMADRYAIGSLDEASAYLHHAVLGPRLVECTRIVNSVEGHSAEEIFGYPDHLKFRSSMTLFARVPGADPAFGQALEKYFAGRPDSRTLQLLG